MQAGVDASVMVAVLEMMPWIWMAILVVQVVASGLLLGERGPAGWLMLTGSVVLVGVNVFSNVATHPPDELAGMTLDVHVAMNATGILGGALFVVGLLMLALRRRAASRRVAELEAILEEVQGRG
jgi:hypothetical protein